jgi:hypothetical protein
MAWFELARVRTELFHLLVIPSLAPHPVQTNRQAPRHRDFGDLPPPAHHQVEIFAAPFRKAANCDLRRFHQQETHHRTPLFRDVPQPSPVPTGILQRHQPQIARDLLATLKPIGLADDQHKGQCGQGTDSRVRHQSPRLRTLLGLLLDRLTQFRDHRV